MSKKIDKKYCRNRRVRLLLRIKRDQNKNANTKKESELKTGV